jgi:hypothetical protein
MFRAPGTCFWKPTPEIDFSAGLNFKDFLPRAGPASGRFDVGYQLGNLQAQRYTLPAFQAGVGIRRVQKGPQLMPFLFQVDDPDLLGLVEIRFDREPAFPDFRIKGPDALTQFLFVVHGFAPLLFNGDLARGIPFFVVSPKALPGTAL